MAIGRHLEVPLREQNTMLLAAGYAPRFPRTSLDDPVAASVQAAVERLLEAHDPYPGVVVDRMWNVVGANQSASALTAGLPEHLLGPPLNVYRLCLHPDGLAARTVNIEEWASYLVRQLGRSLAVTSDAALADLLAEVNEYPAVRSLPTRTTPEGEQPLLIPLRLRLDDGEMAFFTTLTTFGTPQDVTLDEIAIELFYPADQATADRLAGR